MAVNWISLSDFKTGAVFVRTHSLSIFDRWDFIERETREQFELYEDDVVDLTEDDDGRELVTVNGNPVVEVHHRRVTNDLPTAKREAA